MNFQLPEGEAVGDEELQELFEGLETIPGLIIADDVLVEDEGLAALFDELEDAPTFSPMASNLNIGRNRRELFPGEAALRSGQALPQTNGCLLQPDATFLQISWYQSPFVQNRIASGNMVKWLSPQLEGEEQSPS
ncbi:hypothetical protein MRS44_014436 [Fusarium solani]|uniref:uncharacterized protein n=1 Tax=Fusarium solani TaxID=169388 RepID=UPI0032C47FC8|nr:hypothetical protein MRS44_014436 [Fusarium solani]